MAKTYNIVFVNYRDRNDIDAGFEQYLIDHRVKYKITYFNADRSQAKLTEIKERISKMPKVDLVVSWGTTVTLGVFGPYNDQAPETRDIPGVFTLVTDPVATNIVRSAELPARNLTGSWHVAPLSNQLRSMLMYKPATRIGALFTPSEQNSLVAVKELKRQAELIGVDVVAIPFDFQNGEPVSTNAQEALNELHARGCTWLYLPPDSFLGTQARSLVIPEAHKLGMLTFASTEQLMLSGATFGLAASYYDLGLLTGEKAERILVDGEKPAAIPITTVKRFDHFMNTDVAKKFGINVDDPLFDSVKRVRAP